MIDVKIILKKISTRKVDDYILSGFSLSTMSKFKDIGDKHDVYRGHDCMKKFYKSSREYAVEMIDFKKKKVRLLTNEQRESYKNAKICYICQEEFEDKYAKDKNIVKSGIITIRQVNIDVLHVAYII